MDPIADPAIVRFRDTPHNPGAVVAVAARTDVGPIYGLAVDSRRGDIYAGAFLSYVELGPADTGAVYGVDGVSGAVEGFATLDGGPDP